jgi:hypothetical protein
MGVGSPLADESGITPILGVGHQELGGLPMGGRLIPTPRDKCRVQGVIGIEKVAGDERLISHSNYS